FNRFRIPIKDSDRAKVNPAARSVGFLEPLVNRFAAVRQGSFPHEHRRDAYKHDNEQAKESNFAFHQIPYAREPRKGPSWQTRSGGRDGPYLTKRAWEIRCKGSSKDIIVGCLPPIRRLASRQPFRPNSRALNAFPFAAMAWHDPCLLV